jgi:hypothetical protein
LRPTLIAERCRQRGERKNQGITVVQTRHGLDCGEKG